MSDLARIMLERVSRRASGDARLASDLAAIDRHIRIQRRNNLLVGLAVAFGSLAMMLLLMFAILSASRS